MEVKKKGRMFFKILSKQFSENHCCNSSQCDYKCCYEVNVVADKDVIRGHVYLLTSNTEETTIIPTTKHWFMKTKLDKHQWEAIQVMRVAIRWLSISIEAIQTLFTYTTMSPCNGIGRYFSKKKSRADSDIETQPMPNIPQRNLYLLIQNIAFLGMSNRGAFKKHWVFVRKIKSNDTTRILVNFNREQFFNQAPLLDSSSDKLS
jgi:hypothetical protein